MRLIYEMLHPSPKPSEASEALYCLPGCARHRIDDGSMMIGCDVCDNWYHPPCLPPHMVPADDDSFVCPLCLPSAKYRKA